MKTKLWQIVIINVLPFVICFHLRELITEIKYIINKNVIIDNLVFNYQSL